jgi:hypothetical protein
MTVNSLANFGVPGLNGDRSASLQPILSNRFRVLFFNFGTPGEVAPYDLTRQIRRMGRPNLTFETQTLYSYVSTVYINTRAEWQELTVTFIDDITNSVQIRVQEQVAKQQNFFDQTMSRAGENYKFEMDLDVLAGGASAGGSASDPNIIQKWCYAGCQITGMDLGELTYEDATAMEISLTLRYDNVIGFNQDGFRMGVFSQAGEIVTQAGVAASGIGAQGSISTAGSTSSVITSARLNLNIGPGGAISGSAGLGLGIGPFSGNIGVGF